MLFLVDTTTRRATAIGTARFADLKLKERYDIQEWVLGTPGLLGEELLVVASEYDRFDRADDRLDVLGIDRRGKLVVVELKRSAYGSHADLQALRYAAFCSTLGLGDVAEMMVAERAKRGSPLSVEEARVEIEAFVSDPTFDELDNKPRIILAAEAFPPEITATVLWLRSFEMDVTCVRLIPHLVGDQLVLESAVLIPLPEARDYLVRRERKEVEQTARIRAAPTTIEEFLEEVPSVVRPVLEATRRKLLERPGVVERVYRKGLSYRDAEGYWITWLDYRRTELRALVPPEAAAEALRVVRRNPAGWQTVVVPDTDAVEEAVRLMTSNYGVRHKTLTGGESGLRDFYVNIGEGEHRTWADCWRYGFISAGQKPWYSRTLDALRTGDRVFANIPQTGYVGIGIVRSPAVRIRDFRVAVDGEERPLLEAPVTAPKMWENADDVEKAEYVVGVDWVVAVPQEQAVWEEKMFANQNSACFLSDEFTRQRVPELLGLKEAEEA